MSIEMSVEMPEMSARVTQGRVAFALSFVVLLAWRCGGWAVDVVVTPRQAIGEVTWEQRAMLRGVVRRIVDDHEHESMRRYFPEGGLFSLSFTGFALAAAARTDQERAHARETILTLLRLTDEERDVDPFASWGRNHGPWRGVIYAGHRNLLRAAYVELGGDDARVLAAYASESADLVRRFRAAPSANLESFPHQVWPVDNVVALESLRWHDEHTGSSAGREVIARWTSSMKARIDRKTGLFVSEIDVAGTKVRDGPRGCALSWMFAFLPALDPELAATLWKEYATTWGIDVIGMRGLREWPPGVRGHVDADTGPIVAGIGAAASAFGVAAARANGDADLFARMVLPLEIMTAPSFTWRGEKELFGGHVLLADVLSVWSRTGRAVDGESVAAVAPPLAPTLVAVALLLAPLALAARTAARSWRRRSRAGARWVVYTHVVIAVLTIALDVTLVLPFIVSMAIDSRERMGHGRDARAT